MIKNQYIVSINNRNERKDFYNYIINNFKLKPMSSKITMINDKFPFIIDFKTNSLWITHSITCLACASQNNKIIDKETFYQSIKNDLLQ